MSKIEWTNETWNPIIGCTKISPGCDNCYAEIMAFRLMHMPYTSYYQNVLKDNGESHPHKFRNLPKWNGKTHFVKSQLEKPLKWKKPRMVFVCSMGDLFHESVPFIEIDSIFSIMSDNDQHTYQILTKRPDRMREFFYWKSDWYGKKWQPKDNIWFGVTAENQEQANIRIPVLLKIPAAVRFVSIEPMLSPIDISNYLKVINESGWHDFGGPFSGRNKLDWVICGGESGHKARPMHPDWVRSLRDQCKAAEVPFFFKQWGEWMPTEDFVDNLKELIKKHPEAQILDCFKFEDELRITKLRKKYTGRLLDGVEHNEMPIIK